MHILTKRGNLDNVITYEHICDTTEDMAFIERKYITLGSTCVVLSGDSGGMEVYMADSNKEWHDIMVTGGNEATTAGLELHVCTAAEVQNGKPNVDTPLESTLYLVPSGAESGNLYDEYVYVNEQWELFGGARVSLDGYATESWVQQQDYLTRVPHATETDYGTIKLGAGLAQLVDAQGNDEGIGVLLAPNSIIKQGTQTNWAVPVSGAGAAAFYGLAKAAGDTTQAQSSNAVGTYTAAAKTAIQGMLDVPSNSAIPTKVSDLTNDSGFITSFTESDPTVPAWAKAASKPTYTAAEVGAPTTAQMNTAIATAIGNIHSFDVQVVQTLPTQDIEDHTIYFVPKSGETNDIYDEYLYINNQWEMVGNTQVDLSNYLTTSDIATWAKASQKPTYTAQEVGALPSSTTIPSKTSDLTNDSGYATEAWISAQGFVKNYTLTVTALTQDNVAVTGQTVTVRANNAQGEVYATAAYNGQPVSFSVPNGFSYYISISDTLNSHFNPTIASGIVSNTNVAVTLQYSDFSNIRSARDIKAALNAGIDLTALVGEQITCTKGSDTLTWDVVDYDATNKNIMLLLHDCFGSANMIFEPAQALMWCENELAAGSYTFKDGNTSYYFTTTTAIPAGGQLRATDTTFYTYQSQSATGILETGTISTDEIVGATDLGTCGQGLLNVFSRNRYGSNNIAESAIQWWLNSDAAANTFRPFITKFQRAHSYNVPGFMNELDQNFTECLDEVEWKCSTNNVYECPKSLGGLTDGTSRAYTIKAKFSLASEMEIFGSYGGNQDGSTIFDLYNGADADDRKKYRGTSAQVWWLRSPLWNYAHDERHVVSSGSASYDYASHSCAVVPACRISKDEEDENT